MTHLSCNRSGKRPVRGAEPQSFAETIAVKLFAMRKRRKRFAAPSLPRLYRTFNPDFNP